MRIYLSHAIRGAKGALATAEDMAVNCLKATMFVEVLRMNISYRAASGDLLYVEHRDGVLELGRGTEFYVPAEHEDFVSLAYQKGYVTESQILEIDCEILGRCDAVLALGPISSGMRAEIDYANSKNIPVYYIGGE